MWKYKSQTLISLIGLAVGFTCFALATLWIRYEITYDSFHKNAKQMYVVYEPSFLNLSGYSKRTGFKMASNLKETFPEIVNATSLYPFSDKSEITVNEAKFSAMIIRTDTSFFRMFDVKILEGSFDFLIQGSNKIAITKEKARQIFGNESPIGKTVSLSSYEYTICAVVSDMSKRSNYIFDFIMPFEIEEYSDKFGAQTIIELFPGINIKLFEKKLYEHNIHIARDIYRSNYVMKPITKKRYLDPDIAKEVKFQHILIFAVSGLLVILCSLFNYLTLFVSRFRMRQKELALRVVCGASGGSLLMMMSVEFFLTLLFALVVGCALTQLLHKPFLILSEIQMDLPAIYRESLLYIACVILISLLLFWLILYILRKRSLNVSIRRSNTHLSRKISVIVQLIISIGFAFCAIVIIKQMYFLHHTDELGFSFQNRGSVFITDPEANNGILANLLKQIPEITETVDAGRASSLIGAVFKVPGTHIAKSWDEKPFDAENIEIRKAVVPSEYFSFYDLRLLAGEMLMNYDPDSLVMLNESAVRAFGWNEAVGKVIDKYTVKGVIKNIYNFAPTIEAKPIFYSKKIHLNMTIHMFDSDVNYMFRTILFKYQEGMWKSCKEKIELVIKEYDSSNVGNAIIKNDEEEYNIFLKSESALIKLLSFVSVICILICLFGFVSLVSLTCEERRKEIAIRKINGATSGDILAIFAKEYLLLLFIGAVIAFTAGYFIMQRWLEQYVKQTSIPVWIYLSIVIVMAFVIFLCVGWQVWRASIENPAEVVKSE